MIDLKSIYQNESVEDVLLYFGPKTSYPSIDRCYVRYKFEVVEKAILIKTMGKLLQEGKLAKDNKGLAIKGPNWREPDFVTQKNMALNNHKTRIFVNFL
ncbi:immunity protein [Proteus hauseri]|uniref:immunity protein n=1 Tax=Proteus hauseri TaxID=183417 RepID=UPI001009782F|nr:immunity protein [Proteus hauseri]QAV24417.1 immunity protein [Proteus hauseri]